MVVGVQDRHKLQDALEIKTWKTRWFNPLGDTRPSNGHRRYIAHVFPLAFTNRFLIVQERWPDKRLSGGCQRGNIS